MYEIALLGAPSCSQIEEIESLLSVMIQPFGLRFGQDVLCFVKPNEFIPSPLNSAAAAFFCSKNVALANVADLLRKGIPVIPVVSTESPLSEELPSILSDFNALNYKESGVVRIVSALLECIGLLRRQRRIFISYRRDEVGDVAVQLFNELSARFFDVFLDTHGIPPAADFQSILWHRLCDSDVLIMLDSETYFDSRWTSAEFGRALSKSIPVFQILWPDKKPSPVTALATRMSLDASDMDELGGALTDDAVARICCQLEALRSKGLATRSTNIVNGLRHAIEMVGGRMSGVGIHRCVIAHLADGREIVIYPILGVPTSESLHQASDSAKGCPSVAVVYDHIGLHHDCLRHINWLGSHIQSARWVIASEAAWRFADWET